MEVGLGIAALVLAVVGPIGALAFRNESKWKVVHDLSLRSLKAAIVLSGWIGMGLFYAWLFPEHVEALLRGFGIMFAASMAGLVLLSVADWLRKP